jgi:hypothetical protein
MLRTPAKRGHRRPCEPRNRDHSVTNGYNGWPRGPRPAFSASLCSERQLAITDGQPGRASPPVDGESQLALRAKGAHWHRPARADTNCHHTSLRVVVARGADPGFVRPAVTMRPTESRPHQSVRSSSVKTPGPNAAPSPRSVQGMRTDVVTPHRVDHAELHDIEAALAISADAARIYTGVFCHHSARACWSTLQALTANTSLYLST